MEINPSVGTKVVRVEVKKEVCKKEEGRRNEYKGQINRWDRFRACSGSDAKLEHAVFFKIEILSSTGKPIRFSDDSRIMRARCRCLSLKQSVQDNSECKYTNKNSMRFHSVPYRNTFSKYNYGSR